MHLRVFYALKTYLLTYNTYGLSIDTKIDDLG